MPVIEHPTHPHGVRDAEYRYGCFNRAPFRERLEMQDGWNVEGTRETVVMPFRMSRECRYDRSLYDSACAGCMHAGSGEAYIEQQNHLITKEHHAHQ